MPQTIIGKNNILFLSNDSSMELEVHCNNVDLVSDKSLSRYNLDNIQFFMVVFPDKSIYYKDHLPNKYVANYRPGLDIYKNKFKHKLLDAYNTLKTIPDAYYKTDTHINFKGGYHVYLEFITEINKIYNLELVAKQICISAIQDIDPCSSNLGIGDLTWANNLGDLKLVEKPSDNYYFSEDINHFYTRYKISTDANVRFLDYELNDKTQTLNNQIADWNIISNHIIYIKNPNIVNMKKVVMFYDSLLLHHIELYLDHFYEVWFIKSSFDPTLIGLINPDFVFEFRVERFLR